MKFRRGVLTALTMVSVACGPREPEPPLGSVRQPIIGGMAITGDPAIVEMLSFRGNLGARCTATLITPRLLIAAAHCIVETPGFQRHIFIGNDDRNPTAKDMVAIKEVVPHPLYARPRMGNDFCIIVLETPLTIPPMRLNRAALESARGKMVRYVGYGLVQVGNPQSGGIKRQNTAPLAEVTRLLLTIAQNANPACEGDSGGPLLMDDGQGESIIGIGSFVNAPACRNASFYQRVDTQIAWIDEQIQKYDPGGMSPPADGGVPDAGAPVIADAGAETPAPAPPASPPDAKVPEPDAAPASPPPVRDARAADASGGSTVAPPPQPADGGSGGCTYAGRLPGGQPTGTGALAGLLLALAWSARRRRSP